MSENYPASHSPDDRPNREFFVDIVDVAITEGDIVQGLSDSGDEIEAFSYAATAVDRLNDSIRGHVYEVLLRCTAADVRFGDLKLPPLTNEGALTVSGVIGNFCLVETKEGTRIALTATHLTVPLIELSDGMDKGSFRCTALTTDIQSYSYAHVQ